MSAISHPGATMLKQKLMWIVWPAFLTACGLELLVFALIDPHELHWAGQPLALSRLGVYSLAFFVFWALCMVSSGLTAVLGTTSAEANACRRAEGAAQSDARA